MRARMEFKALLILLSLLFLIPQASAQYQGYSLRFKGDWGNENGYSLREGNVIHIDEFEITIVKVTSATISYKVTMDDEEYAIGSMAVNDVLRNPELRMSLDGISDQGHVNISVYTPDRARLNVTIQPEEPSLRPLAETVIQVTLENIGEIKAYDISVTPYGAFKVLNTDLKDTIALSPTDTSTFEYSVKAPETGATTWEPFILEVSYSDFNGYLEIRNSHAQNFTTKLLVNGTGYTPPKKINTHVVCPSGCLYRTIQEAVEWAAAGDKIIVDPGTYYETIEIDKPLEIISSSGPEETVVSGFNKYAYVFRVRVDNVTISGFTIKDATRGVYFEVANNCHISNNTVTNTRDPITLYHSNTGVKNVVENNEVHSNTGDGIKLERTKNNIVKNNIITSNANGLSLKQVYNSVVHGNIITKNGQGITLKGRNNTISNNNISDNDGYAIALEGHSNLIVNNTASNNANGIGAFSSNENRIYHNNWISSKEYNSNSDGEGSKNFWDNDYEGNYWSDYDGEDTNGDGVGEQPYLIYSSYDLDRFPFMRPNGWLYVGEVEEPTTPESTVAPLTTPETPSATQAHQTTSPPASAPRTTTPPQKPGSDSGDSSLFSTIFILLVIGILVKVFARGKPEEPTPRPPEPKPKIDVKPEPRPEFTQTYVTEEETTTTKKRKIPVFLFKSLPSACPKCGAPFKGKSGDACEHCGSIIREGNEVKKVK